MTHTAQDLLAAVGVDWKAKYGRVECPECHMPTSSVIGSQHLVRCRRPSTRDVEPTYTGPALGTPELDAVLLVEGQRWYRHNAKWWEHYSDDSELAQANKDLTDKVYFNLCKILMNDPKRFSKYPVTNAWAELCSYCDTPGHALAAAIADVRG